ncbi:hypothetical protein ACQ4PT_064250 [Festuca glaucescens]
MVGRHAVLLQELDALLRPSDVRFDTMSIWTRIMDLPFGWMNDKKGLKIAKLIDKQCSVDVDEFGEASGTFLRARVAILVDQPLRRWVIVRRDGHDERFNLQYEKLPFYCFSCGLIGHGELECKNPADRDATGKLPFDRNLRVPDEHRRRVQSFGQAAASSDWSGSSTRSDSRAQSMGLSAENKVEQEVTCPMKDKGSGHAAPVSQSVARSLFPGKDKTLSGSGRKRKTTKTTTPAKLLSGPVSAKVKAIEKANTTQVLSIAGPLVDHGGADGPLAGLGSDSSSEAPPRSMMILGLNCRGCGQPEAVHELRVLAERHRPEVLFLSETKMTAERAECLKWRLGFENALGVDSEGQSGGLVLLWRSGNVVRLKSKNKSHIDVFVSNDSLGGGEWRFTGFYGEPRRENRKDSWYLMHFLRSVSDMPWLCMGDFNEVLSQDEHFGRHEREDWQMARFREAVEYCDFTDLGYSGLPYTWDNKQVGGDNVKARLDRVFGDDRFLRRFGATNVKHVQTSESDHCALLVEVAGRPRQRPNKVLKPFRYENMWHRDPSYVEQVNSAWAMCGPGLRGVQTSLRNMQSSLQIWDKEVFGSVRNNLKKLQFQLEAVRRRNWRSGPFEGRTVPPWAHF